MRAGWDRERARLGVARGVLRSRHRLGGGDLLGGAVMAKLKDQVRVYHINQSVTAYAYEQYKDQPGWEEAMRNQASRSLAHALLKEASTYTLVKPKEFDPNDPSADFQTRYTYQWTVEVVMPGEAFEHFKLQQEAIRAEAFNDGINETIVSLQQAATRWQRVGADRAASMLEGLIGDLDRDLRQRRAIQPVNPGELKED
jgi:hypothetical protein